MGQKLEFVIKADMTAGIQEIIKQSIPDILVNDYQMPGTRDYRGDILMSAHFTGDISGGFLALILNADFPAFEILGVRSISKVEPIIDANDEEIGKTHKVYKPLLHLDIYDFIANAQDVDGNDLGRPDPATITTLPYTWSGSDAWLLQ